MPKAEYAVYVDQGMVAEIEAYCEQHGLSASEFFRKGAKLQLQRGP